ncbi:hypothetical protein D9M73_183070 [compost metagenome]
MLRPRLHLGCHAEHARVLQAIFSFKIVEGFVEDEVRLAGNTGHARLDTPIQRIQAFIEGLQVALIASRIGRVDLGQVSCHFCRDYSRIDRR